jgi:hypothetical protein
MKAILLASILALGLPGAQAAVWKCAVDPQACPSGDHVHCVGHGWCGPEEDCDICRDAGQPATAQENPCPEGSDPGFCDHDQCQKCIDQNIPLYEHGCFVACYGSW